MDIAKKIWFPVVLTLAGLIAVISGLNTEQTGFFMLGSFALLIAGAVSVVATTVDLSKTLRMAISSALLVLIVVLGYADYQSIKVPIDFQNEKEYRYAHVVQRLKDIRTAELAFKSKYQRYTGSMDTLVDFVANDSITLIKAFGEVPDTMTLEEAIAANIVERDTVMVPVIDSLFGPRHSEGRAHPFAVDSMGLVPFTGGKKFELQASTVDRSGTDVPVFMAKDVAPFDRSDPRMVGSMTDPKTNGNWE